MHPRTSTIHPVGAITALAFGVLSYSLTQTMLVPAIGVLQQALHTSAAGATWAVLSAPLLAGAILTPLVARLGDRYGRRRVLLIVLTLTLAAMLVALAAPGIGWLIAARAVQGISLAVLPLAFGAVPDILRPERVPLGLALLSGMIGGTAGVGLVCGGLIVDHASWRWLFVIGAGLAGTALVLSCLFVPEGNAHKAGRLDLIGALVLTAALSGMLLALTIGPSSGWSSVPTLALAGAGVVLLVVFVRVERVLRHPLLDMDLVLHRRVGIAHIAAFILGLMQFLYYVLVPKLTQLPLDAGGFGRSVTVAGLVMVPHTLVILPTGAVAARIVARIGPRIPLAIGLLVTAAGTALLALVHAQPWQLAVYAIPIGIGTGLVMTALPAQLHRVVESAEAATANGINTVMRTIGGAVGSQLGAALVAGGFRTGLPTAFWVATAIGITGAALVFTAHSATAPVERELARS
ncbi:MFS transporter [Nocardia suismassiliense]|uniref:MFS transporter n=1 Tax=Nocardia suismassiliense TaxID=2077092 RepID=UPI000D1DE95E|nr:MFS transporter [Nocardia suismassiliense]